MTAPAAWVEATNTALTPLADSSSARAMQAYLKDVAPFLGIKAPARRAAQRTAWRGLPALSPSEVAATARALWALPEREYQYAACDLLAHQAGRLPGPFVVDPLETLLTDRPWWDTVDALGTAAVTPIVRRHPDQVATMWRWLDSGDRWLIRAAIQHQRGLKEGTDTARLLAMCEPFAADREFFIAKAIGWALRDVAGWDAPTVQQFVDDHPELSPVARREALRGLQRAAASGTLG